MQIPKLVVFDVDGTLLNWQGELTAATAQTLSNLRTLGIPIGIATGRPMAIAEHTLGQVGGADWMACGNGSVLFDVASGQRLRDSFLPADVVEPVVTALRRAVPGIGFAIEVADTVIEEVGFARRVPEEPTTPAVPDALAVLLSSPGPVRRVIPFHDDYDDRLHELAAIIEDLIDDRCKVQIGGLPIVDISPAGDHKAAALDVLIEHLGIEASDVVAFGDGGNDIEMLQWAGTGVAMGNARREVQLRADHVTAHIDDGGVSVFLDPLLTPHL